MSLPPNHAQAFQKAVATASAMAGSMTQGSYRAGTAAAARQAQVAGSYATRPGAATGINAAPTNHGRYSSRYLPYALLDFDKVQVFVDAVSGTPENPYWAGDNTQYKFDVSRVTDLSVTLYLRNPNARGPGRSEDIFLGACKVKPRFEEMQFDAVQKSKDKNGGTVDKEAGQVGSEWLNLAFGTGALNIGVRFVENREKALKIEDFELLKVVGKGSFGKVMQVRSVMPKCVGFTDQPQKERYSSNLRSKDNSQGSYYLEIRSGTYLGRAISPLTNQQPIYRSFEILFPIP